MKQLRVVVVGAGKMGAHHARVFAAAPGAVLTGVLDTDVERARAVARRHRATPLLTWADALEVADVVIVATPTVHHFAHTRRALAAGKHVLVEKPACSDEADARKLCELATAHGALFFVGHSERFNPVIRALARLTEHERILQITTRRTLAATASSVESDEPCLNLAVHDIDLVAFLSGYSVVLESAAGAVLMSTLALRAGPVQATVSVGRSSSPTRTITVRTESSLYVGDLLEQRVSRAGVLLSIDHQEPLALQADAVLCAIAGGSASVARGEDGARAVAIATFAAHTLGDTRVTAAE